jgi:general secretion pathway protein M
VSPQALPLWARRSLALGLVALLVLLVRAALVAPVLERRAGYEQSVAQSRALLERYRRVAAAEPTLAAEVAALSAEAADRVLYLGGDNDTVAGSALQARIRQVIERHGGAVRSMQLMDGTAEDRFRRIGVRITASLGQPELALVLYDLETEPPLLFVDSLDVRRSARRERRQPQNQPAQPQPEPPLEVGLVVSGLLAAPEG